MSGETVVAFIGDLILGAPDAAAYLEPARGALRAADLTVAQVEWPHTRRGQVCALDVPAPAAPPENLAALVDCGVRVATLASNHTFDQGPFGVQDTIEELHRLGIATTGAGMTLDEARRPALVEAGPLRVGVLSYNAVGPRESWATSVKAGAAWVRVMAHYEIEMASPGSHPTEYTFVEPDSLEEMRADVERLRADVDLLCVCLHKGMGFVHAELAQYERPLARAAIDAGADVVIGHHAHILRGVEVYRGRPIFHGINHFVTAYEPRSNPRGAGGERPMVARRIPFIGDMEADPEVRHWPYPRASRNTMIARVVADRDGVREAGFVPCHIDARARPQVLGDDERGRAVADYVARITADAGLEARLCWDGDHVSFLAGDKESHAAQP